MLGDTSTRETIMNNNIIQIFFRASPDLSTPSFHKLASIFEEDVLRAGVREPKPYTGSIIYSRVDFDYGCVETMSDESSC